jgi:hypothetical protein
MAFCGYLKQSTVITLQVGPFVDDGDGKTAETGLTIEDTDFYLSVNGAAMGNPNDTNNSAHDSLGYYRKQIDDTDTATLGVLSVFVHKSGALPVRQDYMVITANQYDTLFSTDLLQVDLTQIGGVAQSATDLKDFADTGYDPTAHKVQGVVLTDTCTTNTDMRGTNSAALASVCTETRLAELDAANLPTDIATATAYIDTEVTAIKDQTDLIPADPADVSDIPTAGDITDAIEALATYQKMLAANIGAITDNEDGTYTYKDELGATIFTFTISGTTRTRADA